MDKQATATVMQFANFKVTGYVIPFEWEKHVTITIRGNTMPDAVGLRLLAEIFYFYRPTVERNEATGEVQYKRKFKADKWQASYRQLEERTGYTKKQLKAALDRLIEAGLVTKELRDVETETGLTLYNVMYLEPVADKLKAISVPPHTEAGTTPSTEAGTTYTETSFTEIVSHTQAGGEVEKTAPKADSQIWQAQIDNASKPTEIHTRAQAQAGPLPSVQEEVDTADPLKLIREVAAKVEEGKPYWLRTAKELSIPDAEWPGLILAFASYCYERDDPKHLIAYTQSSMKAGGAFERRWLKNHKKPKAEKQREAPRVSQPRRGPMI